MPILKQNSLNSYKFLKVSKSPIEFSKVQWVPGSPLKSQSNFCHKLLQTFKFVEIVFFKFWMAVTSEKSLTSNCKIKFSKFPIYNQNTAINQEKYDQNTSKMQPKYN